MLKPRKNRYEIITLDKTRSCNTEKYFRLDGLTYYQINDSDELCVCIKGPDDTVKIQETITVTDSTVDDKFFNSAVIPIGKYRVTTILLLFADYKLCISIPDFIQRVYFSEKCANSIVEDYHSSSSYIPMLEISSSNSFFEYKNTLLWRFGNFSSNNKELFKYRFDGYFEEKLSELYTLGVQV